MEAKLDAILLAVEPKKCDELLKDIDDEYEGRHRTPGSSECWRVESPEAWRAGLLTRRNSHTICPVSKAETDSLLLSSQPEPGEPDQAELQTSLILRAKCGLVSSGAIRNADMDFVAFADGERSSSDCSLKRTLLCGISVLDIAVV